MGNQVDSLDVYQLDGFKRAQRFPDATIVYSAKEAASLVHSRVFGASSAIYQSSPDSVVRSRKVTGGPAVWTSGVYISDNSIAGIAEAVRDFGDPSQIAKQVDNQGNMTVIGNLTVAAGQDLRAGSVAFGNASLLAAGDYIDLPVSGVFATPVTAVQAPFGTRGDAITSKTANAWGVATTLGNTLFMAVVYTSDVAATTPAGWTLVKSLNSTSLGLSTYLYSKPAAGSDAAPTFTAPVSCSIDLVTAEYPGLYVLDVTGSNSGTSANISNVTTPDTHQAQELWLIVVGAGAADQSGPTQGFSMVKTIGAHGPTLTGSPPYDSIALLEKMASSKGDLTGGDVLQGVPIANGYQPSSYVAIAATFKTAALVQIPTPPAGIMRLHAKSHGTTGAFYGIDDTGADHVIGAPIQRSRYFKANEFSLDGGTLVTLGTTPDQVDAIALADGVNQGFYFMFMVPDDWASDSISHSVYWVAGATDAVSHTVVFDVRKKNVAAGDLVNAASAADVWTTSPSVAHTANKIYMQNSKNLLLPVAPGDLMRINIARQGAHASDTYVGVVNVVGVKILYTP